MLLLGALMPAKGCLFVGSMNKSMDGPVGRRVPTGAQEPPGGAGEAEGKRERGWDRAAPPGCTLFLAMWSPAHASVFGITGVA